MWTIAAGAFLAGIFGTAHCVGMCGGFMAAAGSRGVSGLSAYAAGRIVTYAILGALAGTVGLALSSLAMVGTIVSGLLLLYFCGRLAGLFPGLGARFPRLNRAIARVGQAPGVVSRFFFGAATGLIPCGLVYAALAMPLAAGEPGSGAVVMMAFGLGTLPATVAVGWGSFRIAGFSIRVRRVLAAFVLVTGLFALGQRWPVTADASDGGAGELEAPCHDH